MKRSHGFLLLLVIQFGSADCRSPAAAVRPGIEVLLTDSAGLIAGKRLALLANQTAVDRTGRRDIDLLLAFHARLTVLFSPEHGVAGAEDREGIPDAVDSASGLPIYSLYGGTPLAQIAALDSVDVILVDLQDVGARYYTYPSTAVWLLREAARRGQRLIVLDRPNPVGGVAVAGNVLTHWSPVNRVADLLAVPMRHGLTMGELVRLANEGLHIDGALTVIPAAGWHRDLYYDATGLPWIKPSPNMPDLESALHYPGTCLFEGTNLSVGRGTGFAFQVIGAPWLDAAAVIREAGSGMREALSGVAVTVTEFTPRAPTDGKYDGAPLHGLRLSVTDRERYDPTHLAVALLSAIHAVHPDSFTFRDAAFDRLAGGPALRQAVLAGHAAPDIWRGWDAGLAAFRRTRAKYLLY